MRTISKPNNHLRVSTGIDHLNHITHGGFLPGKTYLVSGKPGTGKSIFALQFLIAGLAEDRNCAYVCVNEKPDDLMVAAQSLGWDIESAISEGKLQFLDMSPFFSRFAVKSTNKHERLPNEVNIRKVMVELAKHTRGNSAQRLVIDSINSILPGCDEPRSAAFARELIFSIEEHLDCTSLLTFDDWKGSRASAHPIESYVSGIIHLELAKKGDLYNRTLFIRKIRATATDPAIFDFSIKPIEGISLNKSANGNGSASASKNAIGRKRSRQRTTSVRD